MCIRNAHFIPEGGSKAESVVEQCCSCDGVGVCVCVCVCVCVGQCFYFLKISLIAVLE